jgi:hypothetical protein
VHCTGSDMFLRDADPKAALIKRHQSLGGCWRIVFWVCSQAISLRIVEPLMPVLVSKLPASV